MNLLRTQIWTKLECLRNNWETKLIKFLNDQQIGAKASIFGIFKSSKYETYGVIMRDNKNTVANANIKILCRPLFLEYQLDKLRPIIEPITLHKPRKAPYWKFKLWFIVFKMHTLNVVNITRYIAVALATFGLHPNASKTGL